MSASTSTCDQMQPPRRGSLYWALADGLVLAKRNLVQIPRIHELLVFDDSRSCSCSFSATSSAAPSTSAA